MVLSAVLSHWACSALRQNLAASTLVPLSHRHPICVPANRVYLSEGWQMQPCQQLREPGRTPVGDITLLQVRRVTTSDSPLIEGAISRGINQAVARL